MRTFRAMSSFGFLFAACAFSYFTFKLFQRFISSAGLNRQTAKNLPLKQEKVTVTDRAGHYDIDGVSFDTTGVVVASDANTSKLAPTDFLGDFEAF